MSDPLRDATPDALAAAVEANIAGYFACIGRLPGTAYRDDARVLLVAAGTPTTDYNVVLRCRLAPDDDTDTGASIDRAIDAILAIFRARRLKMVWYTGPNTIPADLDARLAARGLIPGPEIPGMAANLDTVDLTAPTPPGLAVTPVRDLDDLRRWLSVYAHVRNLPDDVAAQYLTIHAGLALGPDAPWRHAVGWLGGQPVATSLLYLGAGVAGIYRVATLPSARGLGIGAAMMLAAMREAHTSGCHYAILDAAADAVPLYQRLGFSVYCTLSTRYWFPDLDPLHPS